MAYQIEVRGYPQVNLGVEVLPQDMESMTVEGMVAIGSVITASPVVDAIPAVVTPRPGIITYSGLPPQASRLAPKPKAATQPGGNVVDLRDVARQRGG